MLRQLRRDFEALAMGRSLKQVCFELAIVWVATGTLWIAGAAFVLLEPVR